MAMAVVPIPGWKDDIRDDLDESESTDDTPTPDGPARQ